MRKICYLLAPILFGIGSCKMEKKDLQQNREAKGGKIYGGKLTVNENEPVQSLFPYSVMDIVSWHVSSQLYEGLIKLNTKDLSIEPGIAEKWEVDETKTIYTFYLRKDVKFHNDACFKDGIGRALTANDIKFSFEQLCSASLYNNAFTSTFKDRVLGANQFYEASENGTPLKSIEGLNIIDDYSFSIQLNYPDLSFLYILAQPGTYIIAQEAFEKYGHSMRVGSGPFMFPNNKYSETEITLVKNPNYYGVDSLGNSLPFLDTISFVFIASKQMELEEFQKGNLDILVGLPPEAVNQVIEKQIKDFQNNPPVYVIDHAPEMSTQYYDLNIHNAVFKNKKVRQAFSYAIDRDKIVNQILQGEGFGPGVNGISPPSFKGYNTSEIKGYSFDPEKAVKLLAEAGYPKGKNFPEVKLILNSGGEKNTKVALEITSQLRNTLGVNIQVEIVSFAQKIEAEKLLKGDMFRAAWIADYPNPQNFLMLFHGKTVPSSLETPSYPNVTRYQNPDFDKLYEAGINAPTKEESYRFFMEAEKILIEDAPIIVLYYDENYKLYQGTVQHFNSNPMNYWNFSGVFKKSLEAQAKDKASTVK